MSLRQLERRTPPSLTPDQIQRMVVDFEEVAQLRLKLKDPNENVTFGEYIQRASEVAGYDHAMQMRSGITQRHMARIVRGYRETHPVGTARALKVLQPGIRRGHNTGPRTHFLYDKARQRSHS